MRYIVFIEFDCTVLYSFKK